MNNTSVITIIIYGTNAQHSERKIIINLMVLRIANTSQIIIELNECQNMNLPTILVQYEIMKKPN